MNTQGIRNPVLPALGSGDISKGGTILGLLVSNIAQLLFIFAFFLAFLFLIMGGLQWITSGGDKSQLEQARNKITNALIGLIIVAASFAIFTLVGQFLGFNASALKIPSFGI